MGRLSTVGSGAGEQGGRRWEAVRGCLRNLRGPSGTLPAAPPPHGGGTRGEARDGDHGSPGATICLPVVKFPTSCTLTLSASHREGRPGVTWGGAKMAALLPGGPPRYGSKRFHTIFARLPDAGLAQQQTPRVAHRPDWSSAVIAPRGRGLDALPGGGRVLIYLIAHRYLAGMNSPFPINFASWRGSLLRAKPSPPAPARANIEIKMARSLWDIFLSSGSHPNILLKQTNNKSSIFKKQALCMALPQSRSRAAPLLLSVHHLGGD